MERQQPTLFLHHLIVFLLLASTTPSVHGFQGWIPPGTVCKSVHNYQPGQFAGVPPPMPELPTQYSMTVQANILQKGWTTQVVEHYDGLAQMAAVFMTFNGETTQTIFDFSSKDTYDIYNDGRCTNRVSHNNYPGFYTDSKQRTRPIKMTIYEMFRIEPDKSYTYVGETWVRGVKVHHWTSCQEWKQWNTKFQLDYYFSHEDYQTEWGQGQVPVRAVVNGTAGNVDKTMGHIPGTHRFEHIYDFISVRPGPIKDPTVFHVPREVVCSGGTVHRPMPKLPDNLQMEMELQCPLMGNSMPMQHSIRYDWEHKLVETLVKIPSPQGTMEQLYKKMMEQHMTSQNNPGRTNGWANGLDKAVMRGVKHVDDYNTGLRYITEKSNNTCKVVPLPHNDNTHSMEHGQSLLNIHQGQKLGNSQFTYQGRATFRDLPVDVWGVDSDGMIQKVFFLAQDHMPKMMNGQSGRPFIPNHNMGNGTPGRGKPNNGRPGSGKPDNGQAERPRRGWDGNSTTTNNNNQNNYGPAQKPGPNTNNNEEGQRNTPERNPNSQRPDPNERQSSGSDGNDQTQRRKPDTGSDSYSGRPQRPKQSSDTDTAAATTSEPRWRQQAPNHNNMDGGRQALSTSEPESSRKKLLEEISGHLQNFANTVSGEGKSVIRNLHNQMGFPVLVGMVFRNHSAISTRSMPKLFQEIVSPEVMKWMQKFSDQYTKKQSDGDNDNDGNNSDNDSEDDEKKESRSENMLEKYVKMEEMKTKVLRHLGELDMNVFHYQPLHTDDTMFQVSQCYLPNQKTHVLLHVPTPYRKTVRRNKAGFAIALRKGIAEAMGTSYLHISDLKLEPHIDKASKIDATLATFTLLGSPPIRTPRKNQPSLEEAKKKLTKAIHNGISFKVRYQTHTMSFMIDKHFYNLDHHGMDQTVPVLQRSSSGSGPHKSDSKNYSPATVAGVAVGAMVMGILLAIAIVVVLYRRRHPEAPVIPYKIDKI